MALTADLNWRQQFALQLRFEFINKSKFLWETTGVTDRLILN